MAEINKVDLLKIDAKLQARKNNKNLSADKNKFEDQLLKTVKKLETIGNEIEAMIESSSIQVNNTNIIPKNRGREFLTSIDSMKENFSAAGKSSVKSAKSVAAEYESMNNKQKT